MPVQESLPSLPDSLRSKVIMSAKYVGDIIGDADPIVKWIFDGDEWTGIISSMSQTGLSKLEIYGEVCSCGNEESWSVSRFISKAGLVWKESDSVQISLDNEDVIQRVLPVILKDIK